MVNKSSYIWTLRNRMKLSEWLDVNIGIYISICRLAPDEGKKLGMGSFEILRT